MSNKMTKCELMRRIQEISFAVVELGEFLDTHPECKTALEQYKRFSGELADLVDEYQALYGPIHQTGVGSEGWSWVKTPWPWQVDEGGKS